MEKEKYVRLVTHKSEIESLYRKTLSSLSRLGSIPQMVVLHDGSVEYDYFPTKPSLNRKKFHKLMKEHSWMLESE